jgi:hypothetical protein
MGSNTVEDTDDGICFYEDDMRIHLLQRSRLFGTNAPTSYLIQRTADWIQVRLRNSSRFKPAGDPSAFLVVYHALFQLEGESKITTTSGRQTLQEFICEYLFPRLRSRTDNYVEDGEDQDITDTCISQSFSYLQAVYTWLSHQPGHPWTYGSIDPCTLLYLLQDDPEVQLWDHTDLGFQHIPLLTTRCHGSGQGANTHMPQK